MPEAFKGNWQIQTDGHPRKYPKGNIIKIVERDGVHELTWQDGNEKGCRIEGLTEDGARLVGKKVPGWRGDSVAFYDVEILLAGPTHQTGRVSLSSPPRAPKRGGVVEGELVGTWGAEAKPRPGDGPRRSAADGEIPSST